MRKPIITIEVHSQCVDRVKMLAGLLANMFILDGYAGVYSPYAELLR